MLEAAAKSLRMAQLDAVASDIVYRHGNTAYDVKAVAGKTVFRVQNDCGEYVRMDSRDFIVPAGTFDFEPEAGDTVEFKGGIYEVLAPGGESVWRWSDPYKTALRIHTKFTGEDL